MSRTLWIVYILIHLLLCSHLFGIAQAAEDTEKRDIRRAARAGTWYPGTPQELTATLRRFLAKAHTPSMTGTLRAIVVPHAGYRYSGQVAAYAYRLLQNSKFKRIILVGPSHRPFRGVSVNLQWGYETPLGVVAVDTEVGKKIIRSHQEVRWIRQAHLYEHSLELQVPFLQTVLQGFRIVPILLGQQDLSTCTRLAHALTEVMEGDEHTLLLASTDLSHFYAYEDAKILDDRFIHHIKRLDPQGLAKDLGTGRCEGCGAGAVLTVMMAGKRRGADRAVILKYANSGDVTGDHRSVVGYVSAALIRSK